MEFRYHWRQCGHTQLHGRHAHGTGLDKAIPLSTPDHGEDGSQAMTSKQEEFPCQSVRRHCLEDRKLTGTGHKTCWRLNTRDFCLHAAGNQTIAAKHPEKHHETRRAFSAAVSWQCLWPTKLNLVWADKQEKCIESSSTVWEQGTEG